MGKRINLTKTDLFLLGLTVLFLLAVAVTVKRPHSRAASKKTESKRRIFM